MVQPLMPDNKIGARRTGSHAGGLPQRYILDEPRRNLILARYDGRTETIDELARRLNVPRWKVRRWGAQLGLARRKEPRWTEEDVAYLEAQLHRMSLSAIAKHLGRSKTSVQVKAKRLHVNKTSEGYTMRGLCAALGVDHHKVEKWLAAGWLKGSRRQTERSGAVEDIWYFSDASVRWLVKEHPLEIDPRRVEWVWLVDLLTSTNLKAPTVTERGDAA